MAAVEVTISGMLYDKLARTTQNVVLIGEATLTGLGVGGGPIIPPDKPPVGGGGGTPSFPIWGPPGWGPGHGFPDKPGYPEIPGEPPQIPPDVEVPPPGSPPVVVGGVSPVNPIVPPPFIVVNYPGVGKVIVPQPLPPEK